MKEIFDRQSPQYINFKKKSGSKEPLRLNKEKPQIMHIDLNSAFASAEQQAWPSFRGRPMGVTNRISKNCCVIAASYEAKALGIKVGTRLAEAKALCPDFIMQETDPEKYTHMYRGLIKIMKDYSPNIKMKSIDEGIIDFHNMGPTLKGRSLVDIGYEIKQRVFQDLGKYMRINVGIGTNQFLAKMAASLHKPDGLDLIDHTNLLDMYRSLELEDLTGIAEGWGTKLRAYNIFTPMELLKANDVMLRRLVFESINGLHWHERLRGYEVDDFKTKKGMVGRQWVVADPTNDDTKLRSYMHYLAETAGLKLRYLNKDAMGVVVWVSFAVGGEWHDHRLVRRPFYSDKDIWYQVSKLFNHRPKHMVVSSMGMYLYHLTPSARNQLGVTDDVGKIDDLTKAIDEINDFYGKFSLFSADSLFGTQIIKQKIPFGGTEYFELLLR